MDRNISKSAEIRARLDHPVIDSDGHVIEFEPGILGYLEEVGGRRLVERFKVWTGKELFAWYSLTPAERRSKGIPRQVWWGMPTKNTLDRATAMLPRLLYERLDDFGFDFSVLYPTLGLPIPHLGDEELRRACCRAFNRFYSDMYKEYSDRLTAVAVIPMHTPQEAIDELEFAVGVLKAKACMFAGYVRRPLSTVRMDDNRDHVPFWLDTYGLDSAYNYDAVWQKCIDLKVAPAFHSGGIGWGSRTSISNFVYNRIGHFAAAGEALCKSLFMGGVTRRFPQLKFGFLECGVGWACNLYADLISHWEKRNVHALENYNPANLDRKLLLELQSTYGGPLVQHNLAEAAKGAAMLEQDPDEAEMRDEWAPCQITSKEDIRDLFVPQFFFGCEADDRMNSWAFDTEVNPAGARLNAIFSSDIGHWDVPDMKEVLQEAFEQVERNLISERDFADFVFTNPISFYASSNPDFFKGTVVEKEAQKVIEGKSNA
jgi:predicted TIM-barrel fold metal-dependent hydrolase